MFVLVSPFSFSFFLFLSYSRFLWWSLCSLCSHSCLHLFFLFLIHLIFPLVVVLAVILVPGGFGSQFLSVSHCHSASCTSVKVLSSFSPPLDSCLPASYTTDYCFSCLCSLIPTGHQHPDVVLHSLDDLLLADPVDVDVRQPSDQVIGQYGVSLLVTHSTPLHGHVGGPHGLLEEGVVQPPSLWPQEKVQCWDSVVCEVRTYFYREF